MMAGIVATMLVGGSVPPVCYLSSQDKEYFCRRKTHIKYSLGSRFISVKGYENSK